jgi:hypothetical protein
MSEIALVSTIAARKHRQNDAEKKSRPHIERLI